MLGHALDVLPARNVGELAIIRLHPNPAPQQVSQPLKRAIIPHVLRAGCNPGPPHLLVRNTSFTSMR